MYLLNIIRNRLPGGEVYDRIKRLRRLRRKHINFDNPLEAAIWQVRQGLISTFFFGHNQFKQSYTRFYNFLLGSYLSNKEGFFDFGIVKMPIVKQGKERDKSVFARCFIEILVQPMLNNILLAEVGADEGLYEYKLIKINQGDIVIDAGANVGMFSALASSKGATVYAFEPSDYVIENYLSRTAALNKNIHICKLALSDESKLSDFAFSLGNIGDSHLLKIGSKIEYSQIDTVQTITLDEFVHENNLARIDFIKADIEGAERYMLMGARRVLRDFAPKLAICTYHLPDDPKVLRELILDANPNYIIEERLMKMYAHVPK